MRRSPIEQTFPTTGIKFGIGIDTIHMLHVGSRLGNIILPRDITVEGQYGLGIQTRTFKHKCVYDNTPVSRWKCATYTRPRRDCRSTWRSTWKRFDDIPVGRWNVLGEHAGACSSQETTPDPAQRAHKEPLVRNSSHNRVSVAAIYRHCNRHLRSHKTFQGSVLLTSHLC